jgi:hypothetical protein
VVLPDGRKVPVSGSLTEEEICMSSTARKVVEFLRLLEATTAGATFPRGDLRHDPSDR